MKIGFFGGSFNPPTFAHINLARKALVECNLDKVIFVPVGDFYDKKELAPAKDRYNMLKIACKDKKNIEVSDIELKVKEKIYAIDAFKLIEENYPDTDIYFIMGADNFINIMTWKNSKELIKKYKYIVLDREDIDVEDYINKFSEIDRNRIIIIKNENYSRHSSSKFRSMAKEEREYGQDMIPKKIMEYIKENNLF